MYVDDIKVIYLNRQKKLGLQLLNNTCTTKHNVNTIVLSVIKILMTILDSQVT